MYFLSKSLRRLRRHRKICLRRCTLSIDLCAAAPAKSFACAGDLPQILHGFHPGQSALYEINETQCLRKEILGFIGQYELNLGKIRGYRNFLLVVSFVLFVQILHTMIHKYDF